MEQLAPNRPVVLVVEDEATVLMIALEAIADEGFEAIGAVDADEALAVLDARDDVDVLFTDINMPGSMSGLRLAHAARRRWPAIRIIVTSAIHTAAMSELPAGARFLRKPYRYLELMAAVREMTVEPFSTPNEIVRSASPLARKATARGAP
jgi:CheY-like chemotaxis protein